MTLADRTGMNTAGSGGKTSLRILTMSSFLNKSKFTAQHGRQHSMGVVNTVLGEGTIFQDSDKNKIFVIKDNGLIVDVGGPGLKTVTKDIRSIPFTVRDETSSLVTLLRSQFKDRLETFYFPYPDFWVEEKEEGNRVIRIEQEEFKVCKSYYKYDTNVHMYNAVIRACNEAGLYLK